MANKIAGTCCNPKMGRMLNSPSMRTPESLLRDWYMPSPSLNRCSRMTSDLTCPLSPAVVAAPPALPWSTRRSRSQCQHQLPTDTVPCYPRMRLHLSRRSRYPQSPLALLTMSSDVSSQPRAFGPRRRWPQLIWARRWGGNCRDLRGMLGRWGQMQRPISMDCDLWRGSRG